LADIIKSTHRGIKVDIFEEDKMKTYLKISNQFRELLKQELQLWQMDGLIGTEQSSAISQRYQLDQMAKESTNRLLLAIYIIGATLIGAGAISFVAAHWENISPWVKIVLIVACMLTGHIAGFYLWKVSAKSPRLGHALIVLGTLVFGANIGLMAQIFHIKSNFYNGLYAWAIGAIIMAYVVESVPNAVIAIIVSFIGFCGWANLNHLSFCYYPFVITVIFLPFAYLYRSVFIYVLSLVSIGVSILISISEVSGGWWWGPSFTAFYIAAVGLGVFYFGCGLLSDRFPTFRQFTFPAVLLGTVFMTLSAYMLSFEAVAKHLNWLENWGYYSNANIAARRSEILNNWWRWGTPAIAVYLAAVILWIWAIIKGGLFDRRFFLVSVSVLAAFVLIISGLITAGFLPHSSGQYYDYSIDDCFWIVVLFNLGCFTLCAGLIAGSFRTESRGLFWAGIIFTALVITSRFLEYETGLLIKAVIFIVCGVGIILAGVGFENYLKRRRVANE
jgi:uncharacterized membrane protein